MDDYLLPEKSADGTLRYRNGTAPNPYREKVETEMWREAYAKEYHSHMLTFKVLRQAEYDLQCANKEIERLRNELDIARKEMVK